MTRKKVLVCDDEPHIVESIGYIVDKLGHTLEIAVNGEQALGKARLSPPEVMVLDVRMPQLNGDEVCRILKSDEATRQIHIIILTAFGQKHDRESMLAAGADDYLTKPFSPRVFKAKLSKLLGPGEKSA